MCRDCKKICWAVTAASGLTVLGVSLLAQSTNSLVIAEQSGSATVIQVSGRNDVQLCGC
jgi:hypothetical protein